MNENSKYGVSPIIGILLFLSVTVGITALAATVFFDIGSQVSEGEKADASASLVFNPESGTNGELEAEILRNKNVEEFRLRISDSSHVLPPPVGPNGFESGDFTTSDEAVIVTGVGNYGSASVQLAPDVEGTAEIVAIVNGTDTRQTLATEEYDT